MQFQSLFNSQCNKSSYRFKSHYRTESFILVCTTLLGKTLSHKNSLVSFKKPSALSFTLKTTYFQLPADPQAIQSVSKHHVYEMNPSLATWLHATVLHLDHNASSTVVGSATSSLATVIRWLFLISKLTLIELHTTTQDNSLSLAVIETISFGLGSIS